MAMKQTKQARKTFTTAVAVACRSGDAYRELGLVRHRGCDANLVFFSALSFSTMCLAMPARARGGWWIVSYAAFAAPGLLLLVHPQLMGALHSAHTCCNVDDAVYRAAGGSYVRISKDPGQNCPARYGSGTEGTRSPATSCNRKIEIYDICCVDCGDAFTPVSDDSTEDTGGGTISGRCPWMAKILAAQISAKKSCAWRLLARRERCGNSLESHTVVRRRPIGSREAEHHWSRKYHSQLRAMMNEMVQGTYCDIPENAAGR